MIKSHAPSNIALIKYMGKADGNRPTNSSLSLTLPRFWTYVELERGEDDSDSWEPPEIRSVKAYATQNKLLGLETIDLDLGKQDPLGEQESKKFLDFLSRLKKELDVSSAITVRSINNFPKSCGLASSASSFAALTQAMVMFSKQDRGRDEISSMSRKGSGSSCRSFYSPWALWQGESVKSLDLGDDWVHEVVVVDHSAKTVSSSQAHQRVRSSLLFENRAARAEERLSLLLEALAKKDWKEAFEITWAEFWDMHSLFETSRPSFGYMSPGSLRVLNVVRNHWNEHQAGPLVTMDAGPNVHLIYPSENKNHQELIRQKLFDFVVLS
jgi:diphosphomevalonate decarboxylase